MNLVKMLLNFFRNLFNKPKKFTPTTETFNVPAKKPGRTRKPKSTRRKGMLTVSFGTFRRLKPVKARTDLSTSGDVHRQRVRGERPTRKLWRKMMRIRKRATFRSTVPI